MATATLDKISVPMSEVRAWATRQGMTVNPSGNIPTDIAEAFNRAHRKKQFVRPSRGAVERR